MKVEHVGLPAPGSGVFVPKKRSFYISKVDMATDGSYTLKQRVTTVPANRWCAHTVMKAVGVTDEDSPMELRKNLRILAEAAYGN